MGPDYKADSIYLEIYFYDFFILRGNKEIGGLGLPA
jgi:hypothetical protein